MSLFLEDTHLGSEGSYLNGSEKILSVSRENGKVNVNIRDVG